MDAAGEKVCKDCGESKPLESYYRHAPSKGGRRAACIDCVNFKRRAGLAVPLALRRPHIDAATGLAVKRCSRCRVTKPLSEFSSDRGRPCVRCRSCHKSYNDARDAERLRLDALAFYRAHVAEIIERNSQKRREDPESARARDRRDRAKRKDKIREYDAGRRANYTPEERKRIQERDRASKAACEARRRAAKFTTEVVTIRLEDLIERDGPACYLCGADPAAKPSIEHVIPLSRGGTHTLDNVRVACRSCNSRKSNRLLSEIDWISPAALLSSEVARLP